MAQLTNAQIAAMLGKAAGDSITGVSKAANARARDARTRTRARPGAHKLTANGKQRGRPTVGQLGVSRNSASDVADTSTDYTYAVLHSLIIGHQCKVGGITGGGIEYDD